jgi:hypothetical protein
MHGRPRHWYRSGPNWSIIQDRRLGRRTAGDLCTVAAMTIEPATDRKARGGSGSDRE